MPLTIQVFISNGETEATLTAITGTGTAANPYAITQQGSSQFGTIEVADAIDPADDLLGLWQWKVGTRAVGRVLIVAGKTDYPIQSNQAAAAAAITAAGLATEATAQSILEDTGTTLPGLIAGIEVDPDITVNPTELSGTSVDAIRSGLALESTLTDIKGATFDAATDSLEAIRNRGDSAWVTGGGGGGGGDITGARTLSISVVDDGTDEGIEGARVRIYRTGSDGTATTDADGDVVMARDEATWNVTVRADGYVSLADELVVSGDASVEYRLSRIPAVDVSAETTALSFRVSSQGNVSLAGIVASARLIGEGLTVVGGTLGINVVETATSDGDGLVTLILFRDREYDLSVQRTNGTIYKIRIRTSEDATTELDTAIEV